MKLNSYLSLSSKKSIKMYQKPWHKIEKWNTLQDLGIVNDFEVT